ncbi:MAG: S8 family serine peptidase [Pseudomonadota bacterium]
MLFGLWVGLPCVVTAASIDPGELNRLREEAARAGAVPVMVHLHPSTLADLRSSAPKLTAAANAKAARLITELGLDALMGGRWSNSAGQMGMYVTAHGLDVLLGTVNAISFQQGPAWNHKTLLNGSDGSHAAIERSLRERGFVDLEVVVNAEALEVRYDRSGRPTLHGQANSIGSAAARLGALIRNAPNGAFADQTVTARLAQTTSVARTTLRATREGLLALAESDAVRSVRPVGHIDARPLDIDAEATQQATAQGQVDVIVVMRDVLAGGKLSRGSIQALKRANRATLDDILAQAGAGPLQAEFAQFGAATVRLTAAQLGRLASLKDPRLLAVSLNKPVADVQLGTSTVTLNMAPAWNARFTASGQNIIVLDNGVQANHPFLGNRVVFQACFGTTQTRTTSQGIENWISPCPGGNAANNWDSPFGTPNAAAPLSGDMLVRSHGTHVAGLAAGNQLTPNLLKAVAPSAAIYAVQIFSQLQGTGAASSFSADILAALQGAADALPPSADGRAQPFTINMSLGGGRYTAPCNVSTIHAPIASAVNQLRAAGVPVIVATGNNGHQDAINFPACIPGVVKISAVANDGIGNTRSVFSAVEAANVVDPAAFPGEAFWLAPGGGNGTWVMSSILENQIGGNAGTSMAAPQIAGIYALVKGAAPTATVNDVTAWLQANATQLVPITVTTGGTPRSVNWRRLRLPSQ